MTDKEVANCLTICFTGRRPKDLCGYDQSKYSVFVESLTSKLKSICEKADKPVTFISGGAQGFDQLSFWAVDLVKRNNPDLNIKNVVYVPFRGQERGWPSEEGLFGRKQYRTMLSRADEVVYLQEALEEKGPIVRALMDRNHKMVDASDYVIALYPDDSWETNKGGTSECMRYAKDAKKDILQIQYVIEDGNLQVGSFVQIDNSDQPIREGVSVSSLDLDSECSKS